MLTERQKCILAVVVREYTRTIMPISSQGISRLCGLNVSSATVRNELSLLEELGFVTHPHTSAGRIPTDMGYRYYVDHLLEKVSVSRELAYQVVDSFGDRSQSLDELMRKTSKLLSSLTNQASLVIYPKLELQRLKSINLIPLDVSRMVVVWVSANGMVWHNTIDLETPLEIEKIQSLVNYINKELVGVFFHELEAQLVEKIQVRKDSVRRLHDLALRVVKESLLVSQELRLFLEGSNNVLNSPEFEDRSKTRQLLNLFESKISILDVFDQSINNTGLNIHIGQENPLSDITDCSLVTSSYRLKDDTVGFLGVLGPKRMEYERVIPIVEYMSDEMEDLIQKFF